MRQRFVSLVFGGALLAAGGCALHPPYGTTHSAIPPLGKITHQNNLPPAEMIMRPGPGVGGPGPGVLLPEPVMPIIPMVSQMAFASPDGMMVAWDVGAPGAFDSEPLIVPGRYNFPQGAIYRLKLSNIPNRPGVELYPTLEIGPATPRTEAYLGHNAIPVQFTEEDFDQVLSGNFVTKVIYLPDAEFQELALAGVETLVSTRLDPGVDPIVEADRRGSILAIIRVGNKDLEIPQVAGMGGAAGMGGVAGMAGGGLMIGPDGTPMAPGGYGGPGCPPGMNGGGGYGMNGAGGGFGMNGGGGLPPGFVAGVTAPQYGMPISGTPIGLPGPPHVPLGVPAGLQKHVMKNHTKMHIPGPNRTVKINVKQEPGFSYPQPANRVWIKEKNHVPPVLFHQPKADKHETMPDGGPVANCPPQ